jgi:hypothetical protein
MAKAAFGPRLNAFGSWEQDSDAVAFKLVKVKMVPFDNKSGFQVIIDMPTGTPLEQTARVAQSPRSF